MPIEWVEASMVRKTVWAEGLVTLHLHADIAPFAAGQFAQLAVDDADGKRIKRAYSYASAPHEAPEFFVTEVEGGALSPVLVALERGDTVWITKDAKGFFTLDECPDADVLWMVSTGTGLAPYISMLRTEEPWERYERIVVVHGVRYGDQLAYRDELLAMGEAHPGRLAWIPFVTREDCDDAHRCRIPDAVADGRLEDAAGARLTPQSSHVLLCGNPAMIKQMQALLDERDMHRNTRRKPGHVTTERYW